MHTLPDLMRLNRALSPSMFKQYRDRRTTSALSLDWNFQSPPTIILGNAHEGSGSPLSGRMLLKVADDLVEVHGFHASLKVHVVQKRPFKKHCAECRNQCKELNRLDFIAQPTSLPSGIHEFPFTTLIPNHLPATMDTPLISVSYEFRVEICFTRKAEPSGSSQVAKFKGNLLVARSLPVPTCSLTSNRIFPAAGIELSTTFKSVISPTGNNKASMALHGLLSRPGNGENSQIWRLMKCIWRLEEIIKITAVACDGHSDGLPPHEGDMPVRKKVRGLGEQTLYNRWTSDDTDGTLEMDFSFGILKNANKRLSQFTSDTKGIDGIEVTHSLVIELILIKEHFPEGQPHLATRTGSARILRTNFPVLLTEHPITADTWVEEQLPCYEDAWASPPKYPEERVFELYGDIEHDNTA